MVLWRNGSASDSSPEGLRFESVLGHSFTVDTELRYSYNTVRYGMVLYRSLRRVRVLVLESQTVQYRTVPWMEWLMNSSLQMKI